MANNVGQARTAKPSSARVSKILGGANIFPKNVKKIAKISITPKKRDKIFGNPEKRDKTPKNSRKKTSKSRKIQIKFPKFPQI